MTVIEGWQKTDCESNQNSAFLERLYNGCVSSKLAKITAWHRTLLMSTTPLSLHTEARGPVNLLLASKQGTLCIRLINRLPSS